MDFDKAACDANNKCKFSDEHPAGLCYAKDEADEAAINTCESGDLDAGKDLCQAEQKCVWISFAEVSDDQINAFDTALQSSAQADDGWLAELYSTLPSNNPLSCSKEALETTNIFTLSFSEALRKYFTSGNADEMILVDLALAVEDYVGESNWVQAYLDAKTGEEYSSGVGGPLSDKATIEAFAKSETGTKNRAVAAVFSQIFTAVPAGRVKSGKPNATPPSSKGMDTTTATPAPATTDVGLASVANLALPCSVLVLAVAMIQLLI